MFNKLHLSASVFDCWQIWWQPQLASLVLSLYSAVQQMIVARQTQLVISVCLIQTVSIWLWK